MEIFTIRIARYINHLIGKNTALYKFCYKIPQIPHFHLLDTLHDYVLKI